MKSIVFSTFSEELEMKAALSLMKSTAWCKETERRIESKTDKNRAKREPNQSLKTHLLPNPRGRMEALVGVGVWLALP